MSPAPSRIVVYGVTGCGKSTLARAIALRTGITYHAVDELTWEPGWVEVSNEEQVRRIEAICNTDTWILDSAYGKWMEVPLGRADLIVGLDYPRWLSLSRLVKRSFARALTGEPVCNGNRESLRMLFSRKSIVAWHFQSFARKRTRMRAWAEDPAKPKVLLFSHPREAERWLQTL